MITSVSKSIYLVDGNGDYIELPKNIRVFSLLMTNPIRDPAYKAVISIIEKDGTISSIAVTPTAPHLQLLHPIDFKDARIYCYNNVGAPAVLSCVIQFEMLNRCK